MGEMLTMLMFELMSKLNCPPKNEMLWDALLSNGFLIKQKYMFFVPKQGINEMNSQGYHHYYMSRHLGALLSPASSHELLKADWETCSEERLGRCFLNKYPSTNI